MKRPLFYLSLLLHFCWSFCLIAEEELLFPQIETLSVEEKIGQLILFSFHAEELSQEVKKLLRECHLGGVIYYSFANGLEKISQVRALSDALAKCAFPVPPLIAIDQEGGSVTRLRGEFTQFPGHGSLGLGKDPHKAYEVGFAIGQELRAARIHVNLSPVVDLAVYPYQLVMGSRSFGSSPELVCSFAEAMMEGFHDAGVASCLKHFPGHGSATADSHFTLPLVKSSLETLESRDLLPFAALHSKADLIMTAHLKVPALDPLYPSTASKKTLTYLREQLHFEGVIVSDSLLMRGFLQNYASLEEGALAALQAGCDMLLLGGRLLVGTVQQEISLEDIGRVHRYLVDALKQGKLSQTEIDASLARLFALKKRYLTMTPPDLEEISFWQAHQDLAQE